MLLGTFLPFCFGHDVSIIIFLAAHKDSSKTFFPPVCEVSHLLLSTKTPSLIPFSPYNETRVPTTFAVPLRKGTNRQYTFKTEN